VLVASQGGKKLPENALIDRDGEMGTDPHLLYGDYTATGHRDHSKGKGAIRAFGEHKGSGLALMCELLGGSLTGMSATGEGRRFGNGMLSFYIDPKVVDPEAMFSDDVARYVAYFKSAKPVTAGGEVLVPGEPEQRMRAQRSKDGVPLPDDTWASILATAREVGVDENRIQQATA
jgi:hydroxycarboxylate dehydrogenase B